MSIKEKKKNVNCIRECHISKEDRSTGECFIAVSGRIFTFRLYPEMKIHALLRLTNKITKLCVFRTKERIENNLNKHKKKKKMMENTK